MISNAVQTTVRMGVATTNEVAHILINTVGRLLDTNPDKVR